MPRRFELDHSVRRLERGRLLIGGTPPRMLRLGGGARAILDTILRDGGSDPQAKALARRLEEYGFIHPLPTDGSDDPPVTVVVPVRNGGAGLVALVRSVVGEGSVIVVDDGSDDGSAERAADAGARVMQNEGAPGPAGARNTGLRAAETELVAFLDADCAVRPGWRAGLGALFEIDARLALIAPRVRSAPGPSAIARYERAASPLDLGPTPGLVGPMRRLSYLPSAALIGRRADLLELGGFEESMRFGEDVDLVWRAVAKGARVRYAPAREVLHAPRPDLRAFAAQRVGYGSSAPGLDHRHPDLVAPVEIGSHVAGVWGSTAAFGANGALLGVLASAALVSSRARGLPARLGLAHLAIDGQAIAARHLGRAVRREWLPLSMLLAAAVPRARRVLLISIAAGAVPRSRGSQTLRGRLASVALGLVDDTAYAAGLWHTALRTRQLRCLLPRFGRRRP